MPSETRAKPSREDRWGMGRLVSGGYPFIRRTAL
jgi:hypothetical protein